jgi:hypothetical protein
LRTVKQQRRQNQAAGKQDSAIFFQQLEHVRHHEKEGQRPSETVENPICGVYYRRRCLTAAAPHSQNCKCLTSDFGFKLIRPQKNKNPPGDYPADSA